MRCVNALLEQTFPFEYFQVIIVSDGEDIVTTNALNALPSRRYPEIRAYSLPRKAGPAAARNFGWMLADAPLVAFTDDDCIPSPGWLSALWSAYHAQDEVEVAFSGSTVVPVSSRPTDYERNISRLAAAEFITANCACSRKALRRVGGFDERFKMAWREDSDLQFKLIDHGIPIVKVENARVTHPVRKAPWGICIREERKGMFNALLYKKFPNLYKEKIQPRPPWHYYASVAFLAFTLAGFIAELPAFEVCGFAGWVLVTSWFAWRRLQTTSHSWAHVGEMIITSALIPLFSLFWKFYGSWKYKVLLVR